MLKSYLTGEVRIIKIAGCGLMFGRWHYESRLPEASDELFAVPRLIHSMGLRIQMLSEALRNIVEERRIAKCELLSAVSNNDTEFSLVEPIKGRETLRVLQFS